MLDASSLPEKILLSPLLQMPEPIAASARDLGLTLELTMLQTDLPATILA